MSGRFPDLFPEMHLPAASGSGFPAFPIMELTVAGTALDSHQIPFYAAAESRCITIRGQRYNFFTLSANKNRNFHYLCNRFWQKQ